MIRSKTALLPLFVLTFCAGCTSVDDTLPLPDYTLLERVLDESPGKTQLRMDIVVSDRASDEELASLLRHLYQESNKLSGFKYHDHPTVVALYAYPSREHAASGMGQWMAMLIKTPAEAEPAISLRPGRGAGVGEEDRFGLTEQEREDAYKKLVIAEDRGQRDAEQEFPEDFEKQFDRAKQFSIDNKAALARELGITPEQLDSIGLEGLLKNWPIPAL